MRSCFRLAARRLAQWPALLCVFCLTAMPMAHASGGGGGEGSSPMTFVVNIGSPKTEHVVLQMSIVLKPATPEAAKMIDSFKPMIQHRIMIVAAGLSTDDLRKPHGRDDFGEQLVEEINHDLGTTTKDGVKELFFTSFLYQAM